ncbi:hypothetical protein LguiA_018751 [Lonicera macranthoides]
MAFDQNSMPIDLRFLNVASTMAEDPRVVPLTTTPGRNIDGYYTNQRDGGSPNSIPVYYPSNVSDAGFVGVGCGTKMSGVSGWFPVMPNAVISPAAVNSTATYCYNHKPDFGSRTGSNVSDQVSDEGGDDLTPGKRVKFMCSFGGKILPRPSDGALRYVGGQTRIISVRKEVSYYELVQKMADSCGQNVVIKYQLPGEDLDALVSVSCQDDLVNMMDEYNKLVERSSDGSSKLRVFLFLTSEPNSPSLGQLGDLECSGQRYVEAVNGIGDGVVSGVIMRKDSIASVSTQNSEFGNEGVDISAHGHGNYSGGPPSTGELSPRGNFSTSSQETSPRLVCLDTNSAIYVEASCAPLGIPMVKSQILSPRSEQEFERFVPVNTPRQQMGYDLQHGGIFQQPASYLQPCVDPHQKLLNRTDYVQLPSQMGLQAQLLGSSTGTVYTQPQVHDNPVSASAHQYIPTVQMPIAHSSHVRIRPSPVRPMVQQAQQVQLEYFPDESTFGQRVVQLPTDNSYYQSQVSPSVIGGGYSWHQAPQPEQTMFPEGWVPLQPVKFHEKTSKYEDSHMCQKALSHAHSDTITHDEKDSPPSTLSSPNSVNENFPSPDHTRVRPINRAVVTGAEKLQVEGVGGFPNFETLYESDKTVLHKAENLDHSKVGMVRLADGKQSPYGVVMGTIPQLCQENTVQQVMVPTQFLKQEDLMSKPVYSDNSPGGGTSLQTLDHQFHDYPKDYSAELRGINPITSESCGTSDTRQIDGKVKNLQTAPPEVLHMTDIKSAFDIPKKEDVFEVKSQQIIGRERYIDNTVSDAKILLESNHIKQNEMTLCSLSDVPMLHNFRPIESYEVAQPSFLANHGYRRSKFSVNNVDADEVFYGSPASSSGDTSQVTDPRIPPIGEWKDIISPFHAQITHSDVEVNPSTSNFSSICTSNKVGDIQDSSSSLFSNQHPWNLRHDTHFRPPKSNKIPMKNETFGTTDPFGGNRLGYCGESPTYSSGGSISEMRLEDGFFYHPSCNLATDFGQEQRSIKGLTDERIKQELQAVAEGVAVSVLQPIMPLNSQLIVPGRTESSESNQNNEVKNTNTEMHQHGDKLEDINAKTTEKSNLGSPVSDGIGRLQIIKDSDLEELRDLGSGTFGTVYHGKWRGSDVAIKRINDRCFAGKPSEQERMRDDFWNEAIKLADLHHPNVVAFYGVVLDGPGDTVATVTEYMANGSLRNAIERNERNLDNRKRLIIAMDVAFGMEYLHGKNIVHFDLKSDNLLVNLRDPHRPICKVGDLGLSKVKCQTLISGGVRGTLPWMAPELLNGSSSLVSEKVDVFSFGMVMWELLTGDELYGDLHYGAIIGGIVSNTLRPPVPESCDPEWRALMERCWSSDPSERPTFTEIANQLRIIASKVLPRAQNQQSRLSPQLQIKN